MASSVNRRRTTAVLRLTPRGKAPEMWQVEPGFPNLWRSRRNYSRSSQRSLLLTPPSTALQTYENHGAIALLNPSSNVSERPKTALMCPSAHSVLNLRVAQGVPHGLRRGPPVVIKICGIGDDLAFWQRTRTAINVTAR